MQKLWTYTRANFWFAYCMFWFTWSICLFARDPGNGWNIFALVFWTSIFTSACYSRWNRID